MTIPSTAPRLRRSRALTVGVGAGVISALLTVGLLAWIFVPLPLGVPAEKTGDKELLDQLAGYEGYGELAVAVVDLDTATPVRYAGIGADEQTLFEIGSVSKALTGLAMADAVDRGELKLSDPVGAHLDLDGTESGAVTLQELGNQTTGYPRLGGRTMARGLLSAATRGNPYTATVAETVDEARTATVMNRGQYGYSNLGAAIAGQATAAAAGTDFASLLQDRIFEPYGMANTRVATERLVAKGRTEKGRRSALWVADGYAPTTGVVSTTADLSRLARGLLENSGPGQRALDPMTDIGKAGTIGLFWMNTPFDEGRTVTWHNGMTGGYASFVGLDRENRRAVVVLSAVAKSVDTMGIDLLTQAG